MSPEQHGFELGGYFSIVSVTVLYDLWLVGSVGAKETWKGRADSKLYTN